LPPLHQPLPLHPVALENNTLALAAAVDSSHSSDF